MASLIVFSDDWGRHPSSCQHLVQRLLPDYEVLWVNTIGTRAPRFDRATLSRVVSKLSQWTTKRKSQGEAFSHPNLRVRSPVMWPWFTRPLDRWLNRQLLVRSLSRSIAKLSRPRCVVTTIPLVSDLIGHLDVDRWLYYCVDDLAAWPGLDGESLRLMERALIVSVNHCVAVSTVLQDHLERRGQDAALLTHGVDLEFWRQEQQDSEFDALADELESPWVVFWGLIDERLNSDWLLQLADQMEEGAIILAGPIQYADPELLEHPRVHLTGPLPYASLPQLARRASVLVMPYRDIPATHAMQPLKLKEYLATGLPCVVSSISSVNAWQHSLDIALDADMFASMVQTRLRTGLPEAQGDARRVLRNESWDEKARQFRAVIDETLACVKLPQPVLA